MKKSAKKSWHKTISRYCETLVVKRPIGTILVAALLALIGGYIYFFELYIISDRKQLISRNIESNQRYLEYIEEFGDNELLILVVQADERAPQPDSQQRAAMKKVADVWTDELRKQPEILPEVTKRIAWNGSGSAPLLYLSHAELQTMFQPILKHENLLHKVAENPALHNQFEVLNMLLKNAGNDTSLSRATLSSLLQALTQGLRALNLKLHGESNENDSILTTLIALNKHYDSNGYFFSENSRILTVYAKVIGDATAGNRYATALSYARTSLQKALATVPANMAIKAGIAGMPALESEELETTRGDFTRGAVLSLLGVTALFVLMFGNLVRPALAALCLGFSLALTFAFTYVTVGHLSLLAMIFAVILIALGVDFAIHFLTHYEQALANDMEPAQAIQHTYDAIGSALWMGGLTTAAAFLSASLTEFIGLAELGFIAGSGLIICLLVMYYVYPAMLFLLDTNFPKLRRGIKSHKRGNTLSDKLAGMKTNNSALKAFVLLFLLLITAAFLFGQYRFDTNLLKLQAVDGAANQWQRILIKNGDRSLFAIGTFKNRFDMAQARASFAKIPGIVHHTDTLFPYDEIGKRNYLGSVCSTLTEIKINQPELVSIFKLKRQVWGLRQQLRRFRKANAEAETAILPLQTETERLYKTLSSSSAGKLGKTVSTMQQAFTAQLFSARQAAREHLCPDLLKEESIPESLQRTFKSKNGQLALFIYPKQNTWEQESLQEFVQSIRKIEPNVIGELVSLYENGNSIIRSFLMATLYSLAAIILLLLLWTRSIETVLFSILPLVSSVAVLLFLMRNLPVPIEWNFTNFFALPILIGIGVDSGIHIVRAWHFNDDETLRSALKAVILSTTTTILGFGILATSEHMGVSSLGKVLVIGISACLFAALTLLPISLKLFVKRGH